MDDQKILPSQESIRRCFERATALYEHPQGNGKCSRRTKKNASGGRDISNYQVNEPAPTEEYFQNILEHLLKLAAQRPDSLVTLRRYLGRWARPVAPKHLPHRSFSVRRCVGGWLKCGIATFTEFELKVQTLLPNIASYWMPGTKVFTFGLC